MDDGELDIGQGWIRAAFWITNKILKETFPDEYKTMAATQINLIREISTLVGEINEKVDAMIEARKVANVIEDEYEKAMAYYGVAESLFAIRRPIDRLEEIVDNSMWPLPKYREILFIN